MRKDPENTCETSVNTAFRSGRAHYHERTATRGSEVRPLPARDDAAMNAQPGTVRLAVIDTDSGFVRVLTKRLEAAGWEHRVLSSTVPPDELVAMKLNALVVDLSVLGPIGWEFLERVCGMLPGLGVIVVSQGSTVAQRVRGLRLGADDWISKPCHPEEVMARVEAVVRRRRRSQPRSEVGPVVAAELEIRADQFQAFVAGRSINLTRREFELLQTLAEAEGKVLEREEIYQRVWGYAMATATARWTSSSASYGRSSSATRRAGRTSTPTSASATGSSPNTRCRAAAEPPPAAEAELARRPSAANR